MEELACFEDIGALKEVLPIFLENMIFSKSLRKRIRSTL